MIVQNNLFDFFSAIYHTVTNTKFWLFFKDGRREIVSAPGADDWRGKEIGFRAFVSTTSVLTFFSVLRSNKSTIMCKKVLVKNTCVAKKSFYSLLLGHCEMDYTKVKEIIKTIARIVEYCWPFFVGNYFSNDSSTLNWWQENIFIDILQAFHKIVSWHLCIWSCSIP